MTLAQFLIAAVLLAGVVLAIALVAVGIFGPPNSSPVEAAAAVRAGEAAIAGPVAIEEVRQVQIHKLDRFHRGRLDRHPAYLSLHSAIQGYAWCIFGGAPVTSNLVSLGDATRLTMVACFLVGSTLVLTGALMGLRIGPWRVMSSIHDNMTSSKLGDDVRLPYTFGVFGMIAVGVSTAIYASTSFESTTGSFGGWIAACSAIMCVVMFAMFLVRIRQYTRTRVIVIAEAVSDILDRDGHNGTN